MMLKRLLSVLVPVVLLLSVPVAALAHPSEHPFEIVPGSFSFVPSTLQAGAHSDWTTSFEFAHEASGASYQDARSVVVNLPAGFDASNTAVPTCTEAQLLGVNPRVSKVLDLPPCPIDSQVGTITLEIFGAGGLERLTTPVYNMEVTSFGVTAQLGYKTVVFTGLLSIQVRPGDEGLTATTTNIPPLGEVHNVSVTIWGEPAAHEHDALRGALCGSQGEFPPVCHNEYGGPQEAGVPVQPFLSNPTSCGTFTASMKAESWEEPQPEGWIEEPVSEQGPLAQTDQVGPIKECGRVQFESSIEAQPSTRSAESPTGLDVSLLVPQTWSSAGQFTIATSTLKSTTVALPEGMTANPSLAAGLGACSPAQYAAETPSSLPGEGCPPESKVGSIEIETPLLAEKIPGAIYIATPYDNPFPEPEAGYPHGSLLALYVVAKDPERALLIKVAGKITPNPVTGQLTTTFDTSNAQTSGGLPQQPFSRFTLKFSGASVQPLVSPPTCGSFTTTSLLEPWSHDPFTGEEAGTADVTPSSSFEITHGVHEGACPSGGVPPFAPRVSSGTLNNAGGSYSPFYLRIERQDGEQEITRFSTTLPPGLTGNLTGVRKMPGSRHPAGQGKDRRRRGGQPLLPPGKRNRAYDRRSGRRQHPRAEPRQDLSRGPLPRRAAIDRVGHRREGRPVRPRDRRDPLRTGHQPHDGAGRSLSERLRSDPAHHPRNRRARPQHPRLHGPRKVHPQPDQLHTPIDLQHDRRRRRGPREPSRPSPRDRQHTIHGRRLLQPAVQTHIQCLDQRESEPPERREPGRQTRDARGARQQLEHPSRQSRTPQRPPLPAADAAESVHRRAVRSEPRGVPGRVDHRARQGDHADPASSAGRPRVLRLPRRRRMAKPR